MTDRLSERTPLRSLADNLRHELHHFLQLIVNNACEIDGEVSTSVLNSVSPASRIVTATVLINNFVEVIAGVNNFEPPKDAFKGSASDPLRAYFERAIAAYSLLQSVHRSDALTFHNNIDQLLRVRMAPKSFEYIAFVLIDNCYKYAKNDTPVTISSVAQTDGTYSITVANYADHHMDASRAFERGYQDRQTEGYGYGLFWIRRLIGFMNEQLQTNMSIQAIECPGGDVAKYRYCFEVKGVPCG